MRNLSFYIFLIFITAGSYVFGNGPEVSKPRYRVSGTVLDKQAKAPLQYATIALLSVPDSSIVNGIITDGKGRFSVNAK